MTPEAHAAAPAVQILPSFPTRRARGLKLLMVAVLLEIAMILPFVDHLADAHPLIHFTQHGFIFAGGVLLGLALRDVQR